MKHAGKDREAGIMDSGFLAEPVIGPRDFARARWLGPGMTNSRDSPETSG